MQSMTGCGMGRIQEDEWEATVELKTVNHRFLDVSMRLPRNISFLEQPLRNEIGKKLRRGHVDVFVTVRSTGTSASQVTADAALARLYAEAAREIAEATGAENDMTVSRLMALDGVTVLTEREMDQEAVTELCRKAAEIALAQVIDLRKLEGERLREDLTVHLDAAESLRLRILERAPLVVSEYRERLESRIRTMMTDGVEPQRLAQEVALMADRCAIDEELARLDSHIRQMRSDLSAAGEIGKRMDFLIQEMNREANTIGSKASDARIAQAVVELKSEIEKLREQVQNVE